MSFLTVLMDKAAGKGTIQDFSKSMQSLPTDIQTILVKGKMSMDALRFEIDRVEAQIKKVKAEKEAIEKNLASTKSEIAKAQEAKEKTPSPAFNGVMALLKSKYK
ncbi:hypothetical protein [Pseudomonas sp. GWSMS-1]|uniref:hypothetical protein n=1 Tax=Pseudomonas sp. GWSMS-1 TaxID=3308997 RepID=UPI003CF305D8